MKDFLKKYKKQVIISNIWVVAASLVLAFGINVFLIDGTQIGQNLKANVLQPINSEQKADLFIEKNVNDFSIKSSKNINKATSLSFSLTYNWENTNVFEIASPYGNTIEIQNESGIHSVIVNFDSETDVKANENIVEFNATKILPEQIENINIINANFKDNTEELYQLSTSWISF